MKKLNFLLALLGIVSFSNAQTRVSLLEEFTGENCQPCAAYNPALDALLAQPVNVSKIIAIKWESPIPTIPMNASSLYQTNKPEIDWRYRGTSAGGYGYQCQYSQSSSITDGVVNAPNCFIDGKNQWTFGATSNHPYYLTTGIINTAASVPTPFSIAMSPAWNSSFNNCVVTVTITSSSAFTALGNLMFRLCLVERYIEFQTPTGTNGERIFRDAVRQSYPTTTFGGAVTNMGTSLPSAWTASQVQILTINCTIPSYINDKSQMAFVGFIQDDGDRQVYQTARTNQPSIPNDAKAEAIQIPLVACSPNVLPVVTINNNGPNAITALTITPMLDGIPVPNVTWAGNLAPATSTTLPMNLIPTAAGSHTYAYTISNVSGGDAITTNNYQELTFLNASSYFPAPLSEGFEGTAFPPANWLLNNTGGPNTFERSSNGSGYGLSSWCVGYQLYDALVGETDELYLPPTNLIGTLNSELSFDLAYQGEQGANDSLKLFLSGDCGTSWVKIYGNGGSSMGTAPYSNNAGYYPLATEWITVHVPLAGYTSLPQVLIKFQIKSDHGNGLYIDNINLKQGTGTSTTTTGVRNTEQNDLGFNIYPNPSSSNATLVINSAQNSSVNLELENSLGQIVYSKAAQLSVGTNSLNINCQNLSEGIYFVKIKGESSSGIKKLVISR